MSLPSWANTTELRKLFGKAEPRGACELVLSDYDAVVGFLEENQEIVPTHSTCNF